MREKSSGRTEPVTVAEYGPIFCLTAEETFPLLERWFLEARREIVASFRIFDPATRLRSDAGREVGRDWFDLIVHTLRRGVTIVIYVSDFDPVACPELHQVTWASIRQLIAASEMAGPEAAPLHAVAAPHPSRVGLLPRLLFSPKIAKKLWGEARRLNRLSPIQRRGALRNLPGLLRYLSSTEEGVRPRLTLPELTPATHHQKVAVFDRRRLTVGGLDLNERRWDTLAHDRPPEATWHDVQVFLEHEDLAKQAAGHILTLQRTTGGAMPPPETPGLIRTLSRSHRKNLLRLSPKTIVNEIGRAHRRRILTSRRLIYIETQFFRDLQTAARLARIGRRVPDLNLIMVLPAAPEDVAFDGAHGADARFGEFLQHRCVKLVRRAFGPRVLFVAPAQPRPSQSDGRDSLWGAPIIYVHAKVSIFDDEAAIVSSANLNGRSLYWDTELGIEIAMPEDVRRLRRCCFRHWLPEDAGEEFYRPDTALPAWRRLAVENLHREPADRRGFVLPYDPTPAERFGRDFAVPVPNEMV